MKSIKSFFLISSLLLLAFLLTSCVGEKQQQAKQPALPQQQTQNQPSQPTQPATLPVRYQTASYLVDQQAQEDITIAEESKLKVGARITSTKGPQPLWDIIKRLAALKGMNVSWASDVDQKVLVDVDISSNDDFFEAIDNMLRQVDYFHEMKGNTIVVKYKETRQFQIAMPFTNQTYSTGTGGNILGSNDASSNIDGTIALKSKDNEFDVWKNIETNLDKIFQVWNVRRKSANPTPSEKMLNSEIDANGGDMASSEQVLTGGQAPSAAGGSEGFYLVDKPVGIITVTAPRPVLEKIGLYIENMKKSLYQQISIEAKIIEVQLNDQSSIGINWSSVLKNFSLKGLAEFGAGGQIYPFTYSNDNVVGDKTYSADGSSYTKTINPGQFVSKISMLPANFNLFLNALNEQGDTKILSNPKISVMNGQPALISVGRNVTYIDSIESDLDSDSGVVTYTVNTERILSGVGMALTATILGKDEIIMNLVPITSELQEPIEYRDVGADGGTVGLPVVNVREMSTTVKVGDGEMLVIGGLISDVNETKGEFAPVLGDIPLLRYLFGWEEKIHRKRELIILLRPRII